MLNHTYGNTENMQCGLPETFSCPVPIGPGATSFYRYVNVPGSLNFSPGKVSTTLYSEPPKAQSFSKHMRPRTVLEEAGSHGAWSGLRANMLVCHLPQVKARGTRRPRHSAGLHQRAAPRH